MCSSNFSDRLHVSIQWRKNPLVQNIGGLSPPPQRNFSTQCTSNVKALDQQVCMLNYDYIINHTEYIHSLWYVTMHKLYACSLESIYMDFLQWLPHYIIVFWVS